MPTCPNCGATVPEGAVYCGNCGATLNAPMASKSSTQPAQSQPSDSPTTWGTVNSSSMQTRYDKALRRVELLSYASAAIGIIIVVVIVALYLL